MSPSRTWPPPIRAISSPASEKAVELCHQNGIMVIAGLIFGFPDDNEQSIIDNYQFLNTIEADANICQLLTPYLKTGMREDLIEQGLVGEPDRL